MPPITSTTRSTSSRGDQAVGVGGQQPVGDVDVARRVEAAYGDADQLDGCADPSGQVAGLLGQQSDHLRPDRAAAQHGAR